MVINRDKYLNQLIQKKWNGLIKIITGIRRCGKSYLLFKLFHAHLNSIGVEDKCIIELTLDDEVNAKYRNPLELGKYIRSMIIEEDKEYYVFLDEIQHVKDIKNPWLDDQIESIGFVDVLLGLMKIKNADIYITGSNSKMLSSDIVTQFRDRGDEIRLYPLSYKEFYDAFLEPDGNYHTNFYKPLVTLQIKGEDNSNSLIFDNIETKFNDGGWMFKSVDNFVCFFSATYSNSDEGLNDNYLTDSTNENSISRRLNKNALKCPSSENDWQKFKSIEVKGLVSLGTPHPIFQGCEGLVGIDCPSAGGCDEKFPNVEGIKNGCTIFSSHIHLPYDDCGAGKSPEGQILFPYGANVLENNGNLKLLPNTFRGFAKTKEIVETPLWKADKSKSLVCANNQWVVCDEFHLGKEFTGKDKTYVCRKDNQILLWEEKA